MNTFAHIVFENQAYDLKCRFCLKYYKGYNCFTTNLFLPPFFCCPECMYRQIEIDIDEIDIDKIEIDEIVTESMSAIQMTWMFSTINYEDLICNKSLF